ncbi:hypothetical protein CAter282_2326 [Collimonas arenae]|uniref:GspD-like N0 domain-containing protein n=1 Tax=Collimonas arenae TaxID=279058 RepID=A0A127PR17_9BURK|nr:hypothetical protein [Collimonas arenae]AMP00204.1 hypothetical protein CAter10_2558 [Collimonas arenae]AMP10076.1 hypothetical protein CAter282_2326 [Collimonas arenae]
MPAVKLSPEIYPQIATAITPKKLFGVMFQFSIFKKSTIYLVALLSFSHATAVFCGDRFYVIWRDIGLPDATRLVSQYSGRSIHLSPGVGGTINLGSSEPLSPDEIFAQFQKSLQERGLTLVLVDGNEYRIETVHSNAVNDQAAASRTQELVTSELAKALPTSEKFTYSQQEPNAKRRHVGAIFAFEQRAQTIASQLRAAGAEAIVVGPNDPVDKDFSVVLLYPDNKEGYQAMISAIERAGLDNLISTPTLPIEFSMQGASGRLSQ